MRLRFIETTLIGFVLALAPAGALADAPALMPVQGYLTDANGSPVDGAVVLQLSLYETEAAEITLFTAPRSVTVDQGFFTVYLGEVTALDLTMFRNLPSVWLGVAINNEAELTPRVRLATAPFAASAAYCGEASTLEGAIAADFAEVGHGHGWAEVMDVPADLADGDADTLGAISCATGQVPKMSSTGWACGADDNGGGDITSVGAGTGLLGGTTAGDALLSVDPSVVQTRVASTCSLGSSIRAIAADGTVTCETDEVGAALSHVHSGTDLTSGTISTGRFDAYNDLSASGRLNDNTGSDLLTRLQADGRYVDASGDALTGDLTTSGWFQYQPAKSVQQMIGPNQFRNVSEADDSWHYQWNWGAGYIASGTAPYLVDLFATITAPEASTIRSIVCWYRDNHATSSISGMTFRLLGQSGGYAPTVYATSPTVTTSGRNASILSRTLTTTRQLTSGRDWHIAVSWGVTSLGNLTDGPAFYGCRVTYDFTHLRP